MCQLFIQERSDGEGGGEGRKGRGGEGRGGEGRGGERRGGEGRGGEGRGGEGRGGEGRGGEGRGGEGRLASANARVENGVSSEGFTTVVQPAANAGAAFLVTMALGKFQGVISAATPTGCLITRSRLSLAVVGTMSPYARFASSANHSTKEAPYLISITASAKGLP